MVRSDRTKEEMPDALHAMRHSLAHVLEQAVLTLWPDTHYSIGPAIDFGCYHDFLFRTPISEADFPAIEREMKKIIQQAQAFRRDELSTTEAKQYWNKRKQPFKVEMIEDLEKNEGRQTVTNYANIGPNGEETFVDLCRGGHVENTKDIPIDAFKIMTLAGAYWRGDEKREQLTRIYVAAFPTKAELDAYIHMQEEAKKRDHKILGPQLGLFFFHETAPGMPYWLPKGLTVLNALIQFWRDEHAARGYQEISSPLVNKKELWETSGHWQYYKDDMFIAETPGGETYGVKPMNCPNAMIVFGSTLRSYKDLPLRLSDTDILHRHERSGTLNGLLRVRSFRQDDSHNFVTEDQIEEEYAEILEIAKRFYSVFGLSYRLRLGTRPKEFLGDQKTWDRAEEALGRILAAHAGKDGFEIADGDGAFYGPKVDILMNDALGREWQMGTIQLDFQQPRRFNLSYIDQNGQKQTPVVIHRVIYGSLDRFIGILIEHFAGALPFWLAPIQIRLLPINKEMVSYAQGAAGELRAAGLRVEVDDTDETLQKKIRQAETEKIAVMAIVGKKESEAQSLSLRAHGGKEIGVRSLHDAVQFFREWTEQKSLTI